MRQARVLAAGYLSIDRIETPDGVYDPVAGGAALYAALGARFAGGEAGIEAVIGADYPEDWLAAIAALGVDVALIERGAGPTRRALLRHAATGERASPLYRDALWRERTQALAPCPPTNWNGCDGLALCPMPAARLAAFVTVARGRVPVIVADTSEAFAAIDVAMILALLPKLTVFAPSREETRLLCPDLGDDDAARALARRGVNILQKRGAEGALAVMAGGEETVAIAAPRARVVDPTGAGDASIGALTFHMAAGQEFIPAAREALKAGAEAVGGVGPAAFGLRAGLASAVDRTMENISAP